ncbi:MAG: hypothetical protein WDW36_010096 [Sanguina aurantia]
MCRAAAEADLGIDTATHRITGVLAESSYAPLVPFIMLPTLQTSPTPYQVVVCPLAECMNSLGVACRPEPVRPGHAPQVSLQRLQEDVATRKRSSQRVTSTALPLSSVSHSPCECSEPCSGACSRQPPPSQPDHTDTVGQLLSALRQVGYVRLEVHQPAAMEAVCAAVSATHTLMQVPSQVKRQLRAHVGSRFVGFSEEGPRQFYQVRRYHAALPLTQPRHLHPQLHADNACDPAPAISAPRPAITHPMPPSICSLQAAVSNLPSTTTTDHPAAIAATPPAVPSAPAPATPGGNAHTLSSPSGSATQRDTAPPSNPGAPSLRMDRTPAIDMDAAQSRAAETALIAVFELLRAAAETCLEAVALGLHMDPACLTALLQAPTDLPWVRSGSDPVPPFDEPCPAGAPATPTQDPDPPATHSDHGPRHTASSGAAAASPAPGPTQRSHPQQVPGAVPPGGAAASGGGRPALGSDVFRAYRYLRPPGTAPPMLRNPATGLHADMGLLTVSPLASLPGLALLHPSGSYFMDVETACADPPPVSMGPARPLQPAAGPCRDTARPGQGGHGPAAGLACPPPTAHPASSPLPDEITMGQGGGRRGEGGAQAMRPAPLILIVFAGEALGLATRGAVRAPVHYVDERFMGVPRVSLPFFLRPRPDVDINLSGCPLPASAPAASHVGGKGAAASQAPLHRSPPPAAFGGKQGDPVVLSRDDVAGGSGCAGADEAGASDGVLSSALTYPQFIEGVVWRDRPWARVAAGSKQDF